MNQRQAFKETLDLAVERGMSGVNTGASTNLSHLFDMYAVVAVQEFSDAKLGRWLGWAQASVVAAGCASLDEMKRINQRWANHESSQEEPQQWDLSASRVMAVPPSPYDRLAEALEELPGKLETAISNGITEAHIWVKNHGR